MTEVTVWSIVALKPNGYGRGKLIGYVDSREAPLTLTDCVPHVDMSAAQRVRTGNREVCAWVIGTMPGGARVAVYRNLNKSSKVQAPSSSDYVTYDRDAMRFCSKSSGASWTGAAEVTFSDRMRARACTV